MNAGPQLMIAIAGSICSSGSGTTVQEVNQLLTARKQMEKMMKQMGKGKMPTLPGQLTKTGRR